jgi:hypothetical protein
MKRFSSASPTDGIPAFTYVMTKILGESAFFAYGRKHGIMPLWFVIRIFMVPAWALNTLFPILLNEYIKAKIP